MRWWTFLRGGIRWLALPAAGESTQRHRAEACAACEHLRVYEERDFVGIPWTGWCGVPGVENGVECGCLVLAEAKKDESVHVLVRGREMAPAGKATREGVQCLAGRWKS